MFKRLALATLFLLVAANSSAAVIFAEDFGTGGNANNLTTINANWNVSSGGVDLWNFFSTQGLSIDLDGSAQNASIQTSSLFTFVPGMLYELSFDLGNNLTANNMLVYSIGSLFNESIGPSSAGLIPFTKVTKQFSVNSTVQAALAFSEQGPEDFGGSIIDNVLLQSISPVSVSAPVTTLLVVLTGAALTVRNKKGRNRKI